MALEEIPVASIVFEGDLRLQILQALSIDRLYDHSSMPEYTIVTNSDNGAALKADIAAVLDEKISPTMKQKTVFVEFNELLPESDRGGYYDQQALKLSLADYFSDKYNSKLYMMLDAKNHFVNPGSAASFFDEDRPLANRVATSAYWQSYVDNSLNALAVEKEFGREMIPSITPYILYTDQVMDLVDRLRREYSTDLLTSVSRTRGTEFLLYYAQLLKSDAISRYSFAGVPARTLFTNWPQDSKKVEEIIASFDDPDILVFGLHRNRLPQLTQQQVLLIDELWHRSLLRANEDSDWFLSSEA